MVCIDTELCPNGLQVSKQLAKLLDWTGEWLLMV